MTPLTPNQTAEILAKAARSRILVVGDIMLDHYVNGNVHRISPEAPVPVLSFEHEEFMPGGAANVARNIAKLEIPVSLCGTIGKDTAARQVKKMLAQENICFRASIVTPQRPTSSKMRIVARNQQIVRLDREVAKPLEQRENKRILQRIENDCSDVKAIKAIVISDYAKGVVTQDLLEGLKQVATEHDIFLAMDPKPTRQLDLYGLSLLTPNRKEAFELAKMHDTGRGSEPPLEDGELLAAVKMIQTQYNPKLLLITLSGQGALLCQKSEKPVHLPVTSQEVFDVSGAGDTVVAAYTAAIVGGADPIEAAQVANHAAGVVVSKAGAATCSVTELYNSICRRSAEEDIRVAGF